MKKYKYKQIELYQRCGKWEAKLITNDRKILLNFGHRTKYDAYVEAKKQVDYLNAQIKIEVCDEDR